MSNKTATPPAPAPSSTISVANVKPGVFSPEQSARMDAHASAVPVKASAPTTWAIGEVVVLRSGGPPMTVLSRDAGVVDCCWFADNQPRRSQFPSAALMGAATTAAPK